MKLSCIIPVLVTKNNSFLLIRLKMILSSFSQLNIEIIIVDSSLAYWSSLIKEFLYNYKNVFYYHLSIKNIYSAAQARNHGAKQANGEYLLFYDVDLVVENNFINLVLKNTDELKLMSKFSFEIYPCLYLSESKTKEIETYGITDLEFEEIKHSYMRGDNNSVNYLAVNTSTILVNKKHFLDIGGYDGSYQGHGYEDFELIHKLYMEYPIIKRTKEYILDYKTNTVADYRGFRKYYSYYAMPNFFKGAYTLHLWHPRPLSKSYYRKRKDNAKIFINTLEESMKKELKDNYIDSSLDLDFKQYIQTLIKKYKYPKELCSGLFYFELMPKEGKAIRRKRKIRKLFLHPIVFFKDMLKNILKK